MTRRGIRKTRDLPLVVALLVAGGCATLVTGTTDKVRILSTPSGATIEIQGQVVKAPAEVSLSRSFFNPPGGIASYPGYEEKRFEVRRDFNLWTIGNVVTLFLGVPIDVLSGALMKYQTEHQILLTPQKND